jgi:NAD(P)-dependent dehydrogenase (short-subunit alcohol dehydrogenase family)
MGKLDGKVAVITGGATCVGRAAAKRFIEEGAFVFIFGRRQEALDAAVADLGPNPRAVRRSVSDEAELDRLYAAVKAEREPLTSYSPMPGWEASLSSARSPPSRSTKLSTSM